MQEPWFLEINPNGRIPALTDTFTDGSPINLFESGAIMQYLVDRYDKDHKVSYPFGSREYYETNCWVRSLVIRLLRCVLLTAGVKSSCGKWVVSDPCRGECPPPGKNTMMMDRANICLKPIEPFHS